MGTIRDYFETDFKTGAVSTEWERLGAEFAIKVVARMHYDFAALAKYWSFYVPSCSDPVRIAASVIASEEARGGWITSEHENPVDMSFDHAGDLSPF